MCFLANSRKFPSVFQTVIPNYDRKHDGSCGETAQHHDEPGWHPAVTPPVLVSLLVGNDKVLLVIDDIARGTFILDETKCNYILITDVFIDGLRTGWHSFNVPKESK